MNYENFTIRIINIYRNSEISKKHFNNNYLYFFIFLNELKKMNKNIYYILYYIII